MADAQELAWNGEYEMGIDRIARRRLKRLVSAVAVAFATTAGCDSSPGERQPARSPASHPSRATEVQEHREFIADTGQRIDEVEDQISELEARIGPGSNALSPETEQSEWQVALSDLEREKDQARVRLERASTASPNEHRIWRSDITVQIERLEASVATLATRIDERESEAATIREILEEEQEPVGGEDTVEGEP